MIARESPLEWGSSLLVALLEVQEPWFELSQRGEVIGSKDFSLDDGAIDLDWLSQLA
jgi:hypothetical protein